MIFRTGPGACLEIVMGSLFHKLQHGYNYLTEDLADERTRDWFLVGSLLPVIALVLLYHNFVYRIGPAFMHNRKPYNIDRLIQIYNIAQIVLCGWFVYQTFVHFYGPGGAYGLKCQPIDPNPTPLAIKAASLGWGYFMMKIFDLTDTIFFILRKKTSQVTFLHVYHHMGMVFLTWFGVTYFPGGQGLFIVFINSFVHCFMYGYYFISNYIPKYKSQLWWKKYLTQLQIIQFFMIFIQYGRVLLEPDCAFPKWPIYIFLPHDFVILYLFAKFYKKAYMTPRQEQVNGLRQKQT